MLLLLPSFNCCTIPDGTVYRLLDISSSLESIHQNSLIALKRGLRPDRGKKDGIVVFLLLPFSVKDSNLVDFLSEFLRRDPLVGLQC